MPPLRKIKVFCFFSSEKKAFLSDFRCAARPLHQLARCTAKGTPPYCSLHVLRNFKCGAAKNADRKGEVKAPALLSGITLADVPLERHHDYIR
jgi:hypothetical protein